MENSELSPDEFPSDGIDPNEPHLVIAASVIYKFFMDYGYRWSGSFATTEEISDFLASQINLMQKANISSRSLGGIMLQRDELTGFIEIGVQVTVLPMETDTANKEKTTNPHR